MSIYGIATLLFVIFLNVTRRVLSRLCCDGCQLKSESMFVSDIAGVVGMVVCVSGSSPFDLF